MSAFQIQTISDREAADKLGFPLRTVRKVVDAHVGSPDFAREILGLGWEFCGREIYSRSRSKKRR